jgi:hypothetical protein
MILHPKAPGGLSTGIIAGLSKFERYEGILVGELDFARNVAARRHWLAEASSAFS